MIIYQNISHIRTGSVLLERGKSSIITSFQNDLHTHICLFVWIDAESGELRKVYEKYKTKPFILDMYVDDNNAYPSYCPVHLSELEVGHSIYETVAYEPRDEIFNNPRYLEVVGKLVEIFRAIFIRNVCNAMFMSKVVPRIVKSYIQTFDDPKLLYEKLRNSDNVLKDSIEGNTKTARTCIDIVCLYIHLLYKELNGEEILTDPPANILINDLVEHTPDFLKVYAKEPLQVMKTDRTNVLYNFAFLCPFFFSVMLFIISIIILPKIMSKMRNHRYRLNS